MSAFHAIDRVVVCAGLLGLLFLAGCESAADLIPEAPPVEEIEPFDPDKMQLFFTLNVNQAISLLKNNSGTVIVDVRTSDEFAESHLPGALSISCDVKSLDDFRKQVVAAIDPGERVLVYGSSKNTKSIRLADAALGRLKSAGFRNVYRMTGGIEAWVEAGQPFVRDLP